MRADKPARYRGPGENISRPSTGNFEANEFGPQSYGVMRSRGVFVSCSVCAAASTEPFHAGSYRITTISTAFESIDRAVDLGFHLSNGEFPRSIPCRFILCRPRAADDFPPQRQVRLQRFSTERIAWLARSVRHKVEASTRSPRPGRVAARG